MQINLVAEGFSFMVLGMSSVFAFLLLMVFVLKMQGIFLDKIFPEKAVLVSDENINIQNSKDDKELVAVITAAVNRFKKEKF